MNKSLNFRSNMINYKDMHYKDMHFMHFLDKPIDAFKCSLCCEFQC